VYYFPGMWDWPRGIVQPLVRKATDRDLDEDAARCRPSWDGDELLRSRADLGARGGALLDRYAVWASTTDRFAPVLVEPGFDVKLRGAPGEPSATLAADAVVFEPSCDAVVVDSFDAYWFLRHRLVDTPIPLEQLLLDETSLAACFAWQASYLGMTVSGTIDNELLVDAAEGSDRAPARPGRKTP
ncbi:MAG: hypothetical protein ACRD0B_03560, partial [Acidimicrobiales bacterium]